MVKVTDNGVVVVKSEVFPKPGERYYQHLPKEHREFAGKTLYMIAVTYNLVHDTKAWLTRNCIILAEYPVCYQVCTPGKYTLSANGKAWSETVDGDVIGREFSVVANNEAIDIILQHKINFDGDGMVRAKLRDFVKDNWSACERFTQVDW